MKKILCVIICLLCMGGCQKIYTKDVEKKPLNISGFNAFISTTVNDIEIGGKASFDGVDTITFTFDLPENVKGGEILCKNGEYTINFKDMKFSMNSDKLPFEMICKTLEECINNAQGAIPQKDSHTGNLIYTFNAENHVCKLYAESDGGKFIKLSVDGADTLIFEDFEYIT